MRLSSLGDRDITEKDEALRGDWIQEIAQLTPDEYSGLRRDEISDVQSMRNRLEEELKLNLLLQQKYQQAADARPGSSGTIVNIVQPDEPPFDINAVYLKELNEVLENIEQQPKGVQMKETASTKTLAKAEEFIAAQYNAISIWYEVLVQIVIQYDVLEQEKIRLTTHEDDEQEDDFEVRMLER